MLPQESPETKYSFARKDWMLWKEAYQLYNGVPDREEYCARVVATLEFKGFFKRLPDNAPWESINAVRTIAPGLLREAEQGRRDNENALEAFRSGAARLNEWGIHYFASEIPPSRRQSGGGGCLSVIAVGVFIVAIVLSSKR